MMLEDCSGILLPDGAIIRLIEAAEIQPANALPKDAKSISYTDAAAIGVITDIEDLQLSLDDRADPQCGECEGKGITLSKSNMKPEPCPVCDASRS